MAFTKKLPTSISGVKGFAKGSIGFGTWALMAVLGLGLFAFALPFIKRIPFVGGLVASGQKMVPGNTQARSVDQWGRRI